MEFAKIADGFGHQSMPNSFEVDGFNRGLNSLSPWPQKTVTVGPTAPAAEKNKPADGALRALIFEFDNVLCDSTMWLRSLWQLLSRLGIQRDFQSFGLKWQRDHLHKVHCGTQEFASALRDFLLQVGLTPGQIDEVEAACNAQRRAQNESSRALPGVAGTLSQLQIAGIKLGVLANTEMQTDELHKRLERLSIRGRFAFAISSRSLGCAKPEPRCYETALQELQMPPAEVGYVGASSLDLDGAGAIGMRTFAVDSLADCGTHQRMQLFSELALLCLAPAAQVVAI